MRPDLIFEGGAGGTLHTTNTGLGAAAAKATDVSHTAARTCPLNGFAI